MILQSDVRRFAHEARISLLSSMALSTRAAMRAADLRGDAGAAKVLKQRNERIIKAAAATYRR